MTTKIRVDNQESIKHLRDLVKDEDLFPFADYSPADQDVIVSITLYRKDPENQNLRRGSREFIEDKDGPLPMDVREAIFRELWKINPNSDVVEKLKRLGIELVYPESRKGWYAR